MCIMWILFIYMYDLDTRTYDYKYLGLIWHIDYSPQCSLVIVVCSRSLAT